MSPPKTLDELQTEVAAWAKSTFPQATRESILDHFCEEAIELAGTKKMWNALNRVSNRQFLDFRPSLSWPGKFDEAADCLLLLLHLSERESHSLFEVATAKFDECKERKWHIGEEGYGKHEPTT